MLFGEYYHQLDEKNRMRIPSKLKDELGACYLVKGSNHCLYLLPSETMEIVLAKVQDVPMFSPAQDTLRALFSSATKVEEDGQGRVMIPASLREYAGITKDIVTIGVGTRCEVWSKEHWVEHSTQLNSNFDNIVSELEKYGI